MTAQGGETAGSLETRLERIRESAKKRIPEEARATMHRATEELIASGRHEDAVGEGDTAPDFTLPDSRGNTVELAKLLERGPVVLTYFRGHW